MSATVTHQGVDGSSIDVTSYRPDDGRFDDLVRSAPVNTIRSSLVDASRATMAQQAAAEQEAARLETAARQGRLAWEGVVVRVDGHPSVFLVSRFGTSWAAIGRGRGPT